MPLPIRKHPIHLTPHRHKTKPIIVFVTVCSANRRPIFANHEFTGALVEAWKGATKWKVGLWLAMPDHIHFFCSLAAIESLPLKNWITFWKSLVTRKLPQFEHPIWQRHFWDTQLRSGDSYSAKWSYVQQNPIRAGLAKTPEEWPWSGQENILVWLE